MIRNSQVVVCDDGNNNARVYELFGEKKEKKEEKSA